MHSCLHVPPLPHLMSTLSLSWTTWTLLRPGRKLPLRDQPQGTWFHAEEDSWVLGHLHNVPLICSEQSSLRFLQTHPSEAALKSH